MELIGVPIDDWWEQAIALYTFGLVPAWYATYRICTKWEVHGEEVFREFKEHEGPAGVFWYGVFWPLAGVIFAICATLDGLSGSRLVNGKPPKELLGEANEKRAERLLKDDTYE
jgi:hypothetical protein